MAETGEHYYLCTPAGQLQAELNQDGEIQQQIIWLGWTPVAILDQNSQLHYIHTDHLGTPRMATDQKQAITWQWESTPYGVGQPEENGLALNLRMPGQYYDAESGLFYNWNRYYDPSTGEYTRPDPLGEQSDKQLYRYAGGNPVMAVDSTGLVFYWKANITALSGSTKLNYVQGVKGVIAGDLAGEVLALSMKSDCVDGIYYNVKLLATTGGFSRGIPVSLTGSANVVFEDPNKIPSPENLAGDFGVLHFGFALWEWGGSYTAILLGDATSITSGGSQFGFDFSQAEMKGKSYVVESEIKCCD